LIGISDYASISVAVQKFEEAEVQEITKKLCLLLYEGPEDLMDVYSLGLKTVICSIPETFGMNVGKVFAQSLLMCLAYSSKRSAISGYILDLFKDVFRRFGSEIPEVHPKVLEVLNSMLKDESQSLRKKASVSLGSSFSVLFSCSAGALVRNLNDNLFHSFMANLIDCIEQESNLSKLYTEIQVIGIVRLVFLFCCSYVCSRNAGIRIGSYLERIVPLLSKFCDSNHNLNLSPSSLDELRENCLSAFETLVLRCPHEINPYLVDVFQIATELLCHDPNYDYEQKEMDVDNEVLSLSEWGEDKWEDEEGPSGPGLEDDDESWKVRFASVNVLNAIIIAKNDLLRKFYSDLCSVFVDRLKERNLIVKLEIFRSLENLLNASVVVQNVIDSKGSIPSLVRQRSSFEILAEHEQEIVFCLVDTFNSGGSEVQLAVLQLFHSLIRIRQEHTLRFISSIFPCIMSGIENSNAQTRFSSLNLLNDFLQLSRTEDIHVFLPAVSDGLLKGINDSYARVKSTALYVSATLAKLLASSGKSHDSITIAVFDAIMSQLVLQEIELEVKEASLIAAAAFLSAFSSNLGSRVAKCLDIIVDRLGNEITRRFAVKCLHQIAQSKANLSSHGLIKEAIGLLMSFVRQSSRDLKHDAITALASVVSNIGDSIGKENVVTLFQVCIENISYLISPYNSLIYVEAQISN
jgi:cullin-associated NEDD8-dissociated protein 1